MADGRIIIDVQLNDREAEKDIKGLNSKLSGMARTGLGMVTKSVVAVGTALGVAGGASVNFASDLTEVQNVVTKTFGKNENKINDWAKKAATSFGMSELQAKQFNGTMGAMLKSMGLTDNKVLDMTTSMTGLAGDFASFYNLPVEEAFAKIRAGIAGETEPLKQLGVNMSVANLEAFALSQGINKSWKEMTQAEQATLRYNYLMKVSKDAQGDFKDTVGSFANQMRIAKLNIQDLGGVIGTALLPMAQGAVTELNKMTGQLKTAFQKGGFDGLVKEIGNVFSQLIVKIAENAPKVIDSSITVIESFITGIQNNLPKITSSAIKIIESLAKGIITLLPQLLELGLKIIIQLGQGLAEGAPNLIPTITDLIIKLSDMFIANLPTIIDLGVKILMGLVEGLVTALPTLIEQVPRIINDLASAIYSQLPTILLAGIKIIGMLIEGLIKSIPTIIANIPQIIMAIFNAITLFNWASAGKKVIVKIGEGLKSMRGNIGNIAKNIAQWVGDSIKRIFSGGLSWGRNLISNIGRGFSSMGSYLKDLAGSIARGAVNRVKDFFASAKSIGLNLVKGLWNGIKDAKSWILSKIGGWAGSVVQGIKDFFDIHSPSRLMRDEVGVMLIKGIGEGFVRGVGTVKKTINNSLSGVMDGLNTSDLSAKLTHTVSMEQIKMTKGLNRGVTQTSNNVTNNNNNGLTLNIENFNNERQQDVESLSEELEFYRRQNALVTGGV